MKVTCPKCGKELSQENNPFRPFCSERCKLVDLGQWLSNSYSLPVVEDEEEDGSADLGEETGES